MKNSLRFALPLVALVLVVLLWRWTHPKLSDEQQIQAAISDIATQANHKHSGGVANYLSKDFQLDGVKRAEFQKQLTLGMLQYAVINLRTSDVQVRTNGDTATTTGQYHLGLKIEFSSPEQTTDSAFKLTWKREDGGWKISNADGNKLPPGLTGG